VETGIQTLALRRLDPFRGVIQLVIAGSARAASSDGWNWEIQVYADRPGDLWASEAGPRRQGLFRFGRWSPEHGLERVPVNPILDNARIIPAAEYLLRRLEPARAGLPFPLADHWERWVLDRSGRPLALLESSLEAPGAKAGDGPASWRADPAGRGSTHLEWAVAAAAGPEAHTQWLQRPGAAEPAPGCPQLPLRQPDRRPDTAAAYGAWLARLAPRLLTLPDLADGLRARLEALAADRPLEVARYWRLYPKVVDPARLKQARVEARLRRANASD
jgi:hypothetical protein